MLFYDCIKLWGETKLWNLQKPAETREMTASFALTRLNFSRFE